MQRRPGASCVIYFLSNGYMLWQITPRSFHRRISGSTALESFCVVLTRAGAGVRRSNIQRGMSLRSGEQYRQHKTGRIRKPKQCASPSPLPHTRTNAVGSALPARSSAGNHGGITSKAPFVASRPGTRDGILLTMTAPCCDTEPLLATGDGMNTDASWAVCTPNPSAFLL